MLACGQLYRANRLPAFISEYRRRCPEVGELLVHPEDFRAQRAEVRRVGSRLHQLAGRVAEVLKG